MRRILGALLALLMAPILCLLAVTLRKSRRVLVWGSTPIISNRYWSEAMRAGGTPSLTLVQHHYSINKREDFDLYFDDLPPRWWPSALRRWSARYLAFIYVLRNASAVHISFDGGPLGSTRLWRLEAHLLRWARIPAVVIPYGGDVYVYSLIMDPALRNGLLMSYPAAARDEEKVVARVRYWCRHADVIIAGNTLDGLGRWDLPVTSMVCIDVATWRPRPSTPGHDGKSGPVKVLHAPNHRGVKGTEFIIDAVRRLQAEGLAVELVLLEKVPNDRVRDLMQQIDILADQLILYGYGMNAIEGMASGLPVLANLDHEAYTRIFRRYSFLDECPILSTTPETILANLRTLVTQPALRLELGAAGREYTEKYHAYETSQYLFGAVHARVLKGEDVDLMNLFHPLKSEFMRRRPRVKHPLVESRLPPGWRPASTTSP